MKTNLPLTGKSFDKILTLVNSELNAQNRVKYANNRKVEQGWELSPISYSYFSSVDAPEFEVMIGNIMEKRLTRLCYLLLAPEK